MELEFRRVIADDIWDLMKLYQKTGSTYTMDSLFMDYDLLKNAVSSKKGIWLVALCNRQITCFLSLLIDSDQGLSKISRIVVDPDQSNVRMVLRQTIRYAIELLEAEFEAVDLFYCTTMTIPAQFQEVTIEEGFKVVGIFPNAMGADNSRLNGMTAYYLRDTLHIKRTRDFKLHPDLIPFFKVTQKQLGLPDLEAAQRPEVQSYLELPKTNLEIVRAADLTNQKYEKLKTRRKQMTGFYPFHSPNIFLTDSKEETQIFVRVFEESRFAAVLAEDLLTPVNPVHLYQTIVQLLRKENLSYFEIINDAADTVGNQLIMQASFVPCCYIPAFKRQNEIRRDYVVFCRSFEYICRPDLDNTYKPFLDFFLEFFRIEWKDYIGRGPL
jgi:hypothetical protein